MGKFKPNEFEYRLNEEGNPFVCVFVDSKRHGWVEVFLDVDSWERFKAEVWTSIYLVGGGKHKVYACFHRGHRGECGRFSASAYLHRFVMEDELNGSSVIDHRSGDTLDNRRSNLAVVSQALNSQNRRDKHRGDLPPGVYRRQGTAKPYEARIYVEGGYVYLGKFATIAQAQAARLEAEQKLHPYGWSVKQEQDERQRRDRGVATLVSIK